MTEAGVALIVKESATGSFTVRPAVTLPLTFAPLLVLVAVTLRVYDPAAVFAVVGTLSTEVRVAVRGAKVPVEPLGSPVALRATGPVKPPV